MQPFIDISAKTICGLLLLATLSACQYTTEQGNNSDNEPFPNNGDDPTKSDTDIFLGPCYILNNDTVLNITSAVDNSTQESLNTIAVQNISVNGNMIDFIDNYLVLTDNIEIDYDNDILTCTLPCGFLKEEGEYEFTVSKVGYTSQQIVTSANYAVYAGGCPGYLDVGTEISLSLSKSEALYTTTMQDNLCGLCEQN